MSSTRSIDPVFEWSEIAGIEYGFQQHALNEYSDCHIPLDEDLSYEIDIFKSLFSEGGLALGGAS